MKQKGFSLIELLVVISVIGVLATIGISSYKGIQSKARDTARKSDLTQLSLALEVYRLSHNFKYIASVNSTCNATDTQSFYTTITSYMANQIVPKDPKDQTQYCYYSFNNGGSYRLFAKLENCNESGNNFLCSFTNYNYTVYSNDLTLTSSSGDSYLPTAFPTSGLVAYYKMNEGSGTAVSDSQGTSNGTALGTIITTGKLGNGRIFNGTSDYINIPVAAGSALDINNATNVVTISAWVKPTNVNNARQGIFNRGYCGCQAGGSGYGIDLGLNGNAKFNLGGMAGGNYDGTTNAVNGNWYHYVGIINAANSQIWINGVLDSTGNVSIAGGSSALAAQIGTTPQSVAPNPSNFFTGIIDEVGIWNRALTSTEISILYNGGAGLTKP